MQFSAEITYYDPYGTEQSSAIVPENGWQFHNERIENRSLGIEIIYRISGDTITIPLSSLYETGKTRLKDLILFPHEIGGTEGDGSSLIVPHGSGALVHHRNHPEREERIGCFFPWGSAGLMTAFGVTGGTGTKAIIVDGGRYDMILRLRTNWGTARRYELAPVFQVRDYPDEEPLKEEISCKILELQGGWPVLAEQYREFMRAKYAIPAFGEKFKTNPAAEYGSRAAVMRMRLACKQMPTPIPEQSRENQPPLNVFMTFADVRAVIDECVRRQVGPLDVCLVGWNCGGHDGAYPQIFPVEERLGGEAELRRTIEHIKASGYAAGLHDNYFDSYTVSDYFSWEKVNRDHDCSPSRSGRWGGGQSWQVCPRCAYENARRNMAQTAELGLNGTYFTDVFTVWPLQKCYDRKHPLSRRECAEWRKKTLKLAHDTFGAIMSEGGQDWSLPELDRIYDMIDTPEMPDWCDREIPLFQMTWHGFIVYNTYRGGINSYPGDGIYLRNFAFGGLPTIYWHYIFTPSQTAEGGQDPNKDLRYDPATLPYEISRIKRITDDIRRMEPVRTAVMTDYIEHSPELTETVYSNGFRCIANYGDTDVIFDGIAVKAKDFELSGRQRKEKTVDPFFKSLS